MELDKQEQEIVHHAIEEWTVNGLLTPEHAERLNATILPKKNDRQQLAHYFFIIAVSCALLAFGALFIDEKLLLQLQRTFLLQNLTIAIGATLLSILSFWQARKRKSKVPVATYEIYLLPGALTALIALVYFCKDVGNGTSYTIFLGLAILLFVSLSAAFRSQLLWVVGILAAMGWFGAFTSAFSANNLFLGMNYPVRFTVFGLLLLLLSVLQRTVPRLFFANKLTYHAGLLICFTGLWGMSVFGNYNTLERWQEVRQTQVLGFAILFGIVTAITLYLGVRYRDIAVRDYSILFLLLNLYTRYFEYFWNSMSKGIFFLVLAASFWLVGRWLNKRKEKKTDLLHP